MFYVLSSLASVGLTHINVDGQWSNNKSYVLPTMYINFQSNLVLIHSIYLNHSQYCIIVVRSLV